MRKSRPTSKPLREQRARKSGAAPARKPGNPREEWVMEAPDYYVLRKLIAKSDRSRYTILGPGGWWQSEPCGVELARLAAQKCDPTYLIYAVRRDPSTGEEMLSLVPRDRLLEIGAET